MLTRLVNQFLAWINQRKLLKLFQQPGIRSLALLFVIGWGLSLAIAALVSFISN